jgi:hypothetical protein
MSVPILGGFYLAGGTGLALQVGHRVSVDLDLFTDQKFHLLKSLTYFEDAEHEPDLVMLQPVSWLTVKDFMRQLIR